MALPIMEMKQHQEDVIQQAREQNDKLVDLDKSLKASGKLMSDAIAAGDVSLQKALKLERDGLKDEISSLEAEISSADAKQLIFEQKNAKTLNGVFGALLGIKKFDRDKIKIQQKFWGKYFGTPGDFRQTFTKIGNIGKNLKEGISAGFDKIPGVGAIKSGIGTFFDIIKAGLLLIGGIVALQAFVDGFGKATERLGDNDLIAKFSSGLASIVQVFTGMDEEGAIKLAKSLDSGFNKLKDILIGITGSLGRVLGIVPRIEGETDTIGTYLQDYGVALLTLGTIFPKLTAALFGLGKFTLMTLIPKIYAFGASLFATLSAATISFGFIQVGLLPFIGIGLAIAAAIALLVFGLYKLYGAIMGIVDDKFGGIGNLLSLAFAYIKDGIATAINGIITFVNGLVELFNSVSPIDMPLIPYEMSGGNVEKVRAAIAADVERLENEKAAEPPTGTTSDSQSIPTSFVNAPSSSVVNNNTSVTSSPLRTEPGVSNSYRFTNAYMPF